jgi:hypothetical protein
MALDDRWDEIRRVFGSAFASSLHFAVATVRPDGAPHVTPISSILLLGPGRGVYFEEFTAHTPRHLARDQRISVLAVNTSKWFWLRALLRGRFPAPPAVRLSGVAGERRPATDRELALWRRRVRRVRRTRGYGLLWSEMRTVRELHFDAWEPIVMGAMTRGVWRAAPGAPPGAAPGSPAPGRPACS